MKKIRTWLAISLVWFLLLAGCEAEQTDQTTGTIPEEPPTRISRIIGNQVETAEGNEIGEVANFVLGPASVAEYVVVDVDGRWIPIPWAAFSWRAEEDLLVYTQDPGLLEGAPAIPAPEEFDPSTPAWDDAVVDYWDETVEVLRDAPVVEKIIYPQLATQLLGREVETPAGQPLGEIQETLLNEDADSQYVLLETETGIIPAPTHMFALDAPNNRLIFTGELGRLESAPTLENLDALDAPQSEWIEEVEQHWED